MTSKKQLKEKGFTTFQQLYTSIFNAILADQKDKALQQLSRLSMAQVQDFLTFVKSKTKQAETVALEDINLKLLVL